LQGERRKSFEPLQPTSLASLLGEPFLPVTLPTFGSKLQPRFSGQGKSLSTLPANPSHSPQQIFSRKDCFVDATGGMWKIAAWQSYNWQREGIASDGSTL